MNACEACGDELLPLEPAFGAMHRRCVKRLIANQILAGQHDRRR